MSNVYDIKSKKRRQNKAQELNDETEKDRVEIHHYHHYDDAPPKRGFFRGLLHFLGGALFGWFLFGG